METPKKTYSKQSGRPKVGIGRIRKSLSAPAQPRTETPILGPLPRSRTTASRSPAPADRPRNGEGANHPRTAGFHGPAQGHCRNLNQLTRLANAKGLAAVRVRHAAIVTAIEKLLKQICDGR